MAICRETTCSVNSYTIPASKIVDKRTYMHTITSTISRRERRRLPSPYACYTVIIGSNLMT